MPAISRAAMAAVLLCWTLRAQVPSPGGGGGGATGSTGPSGLLSGTLAAIPATCTAGISLYQATDQLVTEQIYACTAANTWTRAAYTQGTTAPGTCTVGQLFFDTDATAGSNWLGCTASNTWTQQGGSGSGATSASALLDLGVVRTSGTVLTIGTNCAASTPCNVRVGSTVYTFTAAATATITAGTGTAYVYISSAGALTVGHNLTVTCAGCTSTGSITAFPADSVPLWTWTATTVVWDVNGGSDKRGFLSVDRPITSSTLSVTTTASGTTVEYTSPIIASGTAALGTSAISANTCATVVTVAATNTLTSSVISASFTADVSGVTGYGAGATDGLFIISYPSANNVNFKVCNGTGSSITPGAATLNWRVL